MSQKCPVHTGYSDEAAPWSLCEACWRIWINKRDKEIQREERAAAMFRRGVIPEDYCVGDV